MGKKRPTSPSVSTRAAKIPRIASEKPSVCDGEGEEDFPRGGQSVLTPLEKRVIREQAMNESLFKEDIEDGGKKEEVGDLPASVKQTKKKTPVQRMGSSGSRRRVDILTAKALTAGILVLGAVQEVGELEVTVSLPYNMCGVVAISNVSDPLTEEMEEGLEETEEECDDLVSKSSKVLSQLFYSGQLVVCCVLDEVEKKRRGDRQRKGRVKLTVNPRIINSHLTSRDITDGTVYSGWVKSVEDHGYIIEFGVAGKIGFLLKKNAIEFIKTYNRGKPLVCGQIMRCKVLSTVNARSLPVSVDPGVVGGALMGGDSLIQMHAIQPGLLVNTAVKEVLSNGVVVTFLGGFQGSVGLRHLPSWDTSLDSLPPKKKVKGRVLWVDVEGKRVGMSLQRTLVEGRSSVFSGVEFGDIYEDAEIVKVYHDSSSLLLKLHSSDSPLCVGYSPLPLIYDEKQEKLSREHHVGSHHPCRVVQFNLIDGTAIVSLQSSILSQRYMRYEDISVGDILDSRVEWHGSCGMIVVIHGNIRGLCPVTHLSDGRLKNPRKKYEEGKTVKCRVLHVNAEERRVLLTCKKSLLQLPEDEVLLDYTQATVGKIFKGVVSRIRSRGFNVFFFNNVMGYVPQSEMSVSHVTYPQPSSVVQPGQVVECRVLSCVPDKKRLQLSLRLDTTTLSDISSSQQLIPGMEISGEVTGVAESGLSIRYEPTGEVGFIPKEHLSDYPSFCGRVLSQHQHSLETAVKERCKYELSDVLVVCGKLSTRPTLFSLKPSLLHSLHTQGWVSDYSELKLNQQLTGFVKKVMSYGCFVEFPHNLSALAPTKYLQDEFTSDPSQVYQYGQTVFAKVLEVNEDKRRFLVSLRQSDVRVCKISGFKEEEEEDQRWRKLGERLERFLTERDRVMDSSRYITPGEVINGVVRSVEDRDVLIELESGGIIGKATTHTATGVEVKVGSEVMCCVIGVEGEMVRVSLNPALIEGRKEERRKKKRNSGGRQQMSLTHNEPMLATVEAITPYYLVVSMTTLAGTILAYAATDSGQLEVHTANYSQVKIGQKVATVVHCTTSVLGAGGKQKGPPIVVVTNTRVSTSGSNDNGRSSSKLSYMEVQPGDIINVIVKTVKTAFLSVKYHLWQGRVHCCLATDKPRLGHTPFAEINPGDVVKARVVAIREKEIKRLGSKKGATISILELTTMESLLEDGSTMNVDRLLRNKFNEREELFGYVNEVTEKGISLHLSPKAQGFVPLMLAHKDSKVLWNLRRHFAEGEAVTCTVVGGRKKNGLTTVSLIGEVSSPTVGSSLECLVHETTPFCLVVSVPWWAGFGRIDITDLADEYTDNPLESFRERKDTLKCCVVSVNGEKIDLSLRPSRVHGDDTGDFPDHEITSLGDLSEGSIVRGYVKAVTDVGVFVRLGRALDGRVQIKHLADGFVKNYKKKFAVGQLVKAKIIGVNMPRGQVELSLRLSHTDPAAAKRERRRLDRERVREGGETKLKASSDGESDSSESSEEDNEMDEEDPVNEERPTLQLSGSEAFVWERSKREKDDERSSDEIEDILDVDNEASQSSKKTRRQKKAALKAEEDQLYLTERSLLESSHAPENVDDYERLLLSHPNSSAVWVQYMAFLLQTAEVDKARAVGERALQAISFREEGEKLNVWVARLNLENIYGSQETLMEVFKSALQQNDPLEVSRRLAAIYKDSNKIGLAEKLYQTMTRQFRSELTVWTEFGLFLMKRRKVETARKLLQHCLKALSLKQHHVDAISKFAQLEFRYGDAGRGSTMFESLITSYPRRTDLWSVYVDMLVKAKQIDQAREVLERAIHLKVSAKKMKLMFKRYLEFEKQHGSPANVELVKDKARTYVEGKMLEQGM